MYKIQIEFDGYLPNGEVTAIYHTLSECDGIDQNLTANILTYRNNRLRYHSKVLADFKYKVDKIYDNEQEAIQDAVNAYGMLSGRGRNVYVEVFKDEGYYCCDDEDCHRWYDEWKSIKLITETNNT